MSQPHRLEIRGCLDSPQQGRVLVAFFDISGWVLADDARDVTVEIHLGEELLATTRPSMPRPDVLSAFPDSAAANPSPGFRCAINTLQIPNGAHRIRCVARSQGQSVSFGETAIVVENSPGMGYLRNATMTSDPGFRRGKLQRLLPLLQCQVTGEGLEQVSDDRLRTRDSHLEYRLLDGVPIMIQGEPEYPVEEQLLNSPASNHPHPHPVHDLVHRI